MDLTRRANQKCRSMEWRFTERIVVVILYIVFIVATSNCETIDKNESKLKDSSTKKDVNDVVNKVDTKYCHSCEPSDISTDGSQNKNSNNLVANLIQTVSEFTEKYVFVNNTERQLKRLLENVIDDAINKERYELFDGVEIESIDKKNATSETSMSESNQERALFSSYTYEYRLYKKIRNFVDTHILSINLPKASGLFGFRSFGLKKLFWPFVIGVQIFKSVLLAMFLPSILGSVGKILGKGLSHLSASSSQASYPPANQDDPTSYNTDTKDFMGYETNPTESLSYAQDGWTGNAEGNEVNDLSMDPSRFSPGGQKVSYLPSKNNYYKNQMANGNNYKIFQKIPASSMILSNYDPFYSPLLSRLDGIFARLGLAPTETPQDDGTQIGGQSVSNVKLEACREQLICLMYSSPAKYAPYSNLVSAQLSRELNELRRPVSDNPEILRFFRYMRSARQGQEGTDCTAAYPVCAANTAPSHTMISAYHDINKLVTARKFRK